MKFYLLLVAIWVGATNIAEAQTSQDSLYVFVGEKIGVSEFFPERKPNQMIGNSAFNARYRIVQQVYGHYPHDTIEFEAYDHYGIPAFSRYSHALLYVSKFHGKLYHEKYQYADVYQTKTGRWAGGYSAADYEHPFNKNTSVKPELIPFEHEISYPIEERNREYIPKWYPTPYYRIEPDKVVVVWGNYVEQLFELKKSGVLKSRGIFD